jgi:undecaprenyl-diphosphatase
MNEVQAIVLGIVQGLTEFLPISSTAHLYVVPALLGWTRPSTAFVAVIQLGTLVAVIVYFRDDIARMTLAFVRGLVSRQPFAEQDSRLAWLIIIGTLPVVVAGFALKKHIETTLKSLYVISAAMVVLALLMVVAEELVKVRNQSRTPQKPLGGIGWLDAFLIGICQSFALVPGTSRSGVTITGGLFLGLTREAAARFSFLLSLPAVFAAAVLELYKEREELLASESAKMNLVLATVVSGVVGYAAIAFLLRYLKTHTLHVFVIYRLALAALLLALLSSGRLQPEEKSSGDSGEAVNSLPQTEKGAERRTQAAPGPYNKHLQGELTPEQQGGVAWQGRSLSRRGS